MDSRASKRTCRLAAALLVGAALLAVPGSARAELVGEFDARLKDVRTWGAYTAVLDTRVYETDGSPPPELASAQIHFPRGAALRRAFLASRFFCDPVRLELTRNSALCEPAHFGGGRILLDGRPSISDPVNVDVELYLARASEPGAVAAVVMLVRANQRSHAYDFQVHQGHLFRERGRFGHRLVLPTNIRPVLPHVRLRLAELSLTVRGLRLDRRVRRCTRRTNGTRGRCLKRRYVVRKVFWTRTPYCRRGQKVSFGADYAFEGRQTIRRRRRLDCTRFLNTPSAHRKGTIPGAARLGRP